MDVTKIKRRLNDAGGNSGWSDFANYRDYFRILGGVAWPQKGRPGFVVLVGEEARNLKNGGPPKFCGLVESKHPNHDEMLSKCVELAPVVDTWYSNTTQEAQYFLMHEFNQGQQRKHLDGLLLLDAPMISESGDAEQLFRYVDAEFSKQTLGGQKTIFLGECPQVRAALQNVPEEWDKEDILRLPEVTALYYVLGAMFRLPYSIRSSKPATAQTEYKGDWE
jgi:hypothetical protein